MNTKEFQIPVPWGHVAVKAWGDENNTPVFVVHGVGDNAGIFDRVIPLLPTIYYYICIDLPSHGKSSHYPPYLLITPFDVLNTYKLTLDYLNRKKYICMGHSWGAQTLTLFTQLYPSYVLKLIALDSIHLYPLDPKYFQNYWTFRINSLIRINDKKMNNLTPTYTYEEILKKSIENRKFGTINKETAQNLLKRSLIPTSDYKFRLSTDERLHVYALFGFDVQYLVDLVKKYPIKCPMLVIKASNSKAALEELDPVAEAMQRSFNNVKIEEIVGDHNDVSNKPESWAILISKCLTWQHKL